MKMLFAIVNGRLSYMLKYDHNYNVRQSLIKQLINLLLEKLSIAKIAYLPVIQHYKNIKTYYEILPRLTKSSAKKK